jgi:uncharacterized protein (DUF2461 family)
MKLMENKEWGSKSMRLNPPSFDTSTMRALKATPYGIEYVTDKQSIDCIR